MLCSFIKSGFYLLLDSGLLRARCEQTFALLFLSGISVVLDLTPNYDGHPVWFDETHIKEIMEKVKVSTQI